MRVFSLFDAQVRGEIVAGAAASALRVGLQVRVVPEAAGLGSSGDYVFLRQGAMQPGIAAARAEWWACLCGAVKVTPAGCAPVLLSAGSVYAIRQGERLRLAALQDSVLVRAVLDPQAVGLVGAGLTSSFDAFAAGQAERWRMQGGAGDAQAGPAGGHAPPRLNAAFVTIAEGEPAWAERLRAGGLNWAACHEGTLRLQWHSPWPHVERQVAYLQPGMVFAPDPEEGYRIDALDPVASLLCCLQAPRREPACAGVAGVEGAGGGAAQAVSLH
ncbi:MULTISPECIES: hypothetical protein [Cupriavidus]|uniref:hypothetical protein n=1 Tax=Cupriavidus sp. WS TaxID=1312922 RepID=UPI0003610635|nr:hypothetical protein [Cupriavidus sp. WS]